jgi:3-keto-L-gulonate-6-phosphate decarboxylase
METAKYWSIGDSIRWNAIATGANAFTVTAAASGHTVVGAGAVATGTSGEFLTKKTATDTFVTYRVS